MPIRKKYITKDPKNFPNNSINNLGYISRLKMTKTDNLLLNRLRDFDGNIWLLRADRQQNKNFNPITVGTNLH